MRVVEVNLGETYAVMREFLPDLLALGWGRIVNVASIAGIVGYPFPSYTASKSGVVGLTRSLLLDPAKIPDMVRRTPLGRIVTVDEVAGTVGFLCSEAGGGINGAAIVVDGGATAAFRYSDG